MNILIVEARYHPDVSDALVGRRHQGAGKGRGAFHARVGARRAGNSSRHRAGRPGRTVFDGYVALGSLLLAGGPHFGIMTQSCFFGLMRLCCRPGPLHRQRHCCGQRRKIDALRMALKEELIGGDAARACLSLVTLASAWGAGMSAPGKIDSEARRAARLAAVQALYQMELAGVGAEEVAEEFIAHRFDEAPADIEFFKTLVEGVPAPSARDRQGHRRLPVGKLEPGASGFHPSRHIAGRGLSSWSGGATCRPRW